MKLAPYPRPITRRAALGLWLLAFALAPSAGVKAAPRPRLKIFHDLKHLPEPVRAMRDLILEAARSGDITRLHPVLEMNELKPTVSFGDDADPVAYWRKISGDGQGREILAILSEIVQMPFTRIDAGTPNEMYVWPYLAELPLTKLTPPQLVDLYRLVPPEAAKAMGRAGGYSHYRLGIGRDGTWHYFVAGE